jgi:uroporphyrinogen decarboxylase
MADCPFNILHVCDFEAPYADLTPFLDYPGHLVNSPLHVGERTLTAQEAAALFGRPFMGGLDRKGTLSTGTTEQVRAEAERVLAGRPEMFVLAADCTVPGDTSWENLKAAVDAAHGAG